jgi:adenine-specific DNA-methyltransferase
MPGELTEFSAKQQRLFDAAVSPAERKARGHFGTPVAIAGFMAEMLAEIPQRVFRILDPGAGVGTLTAAICQRALKLKAQRHLVFELWENDPKIEPYLRGTLDYCRMVLLDAGHRMDFTIRGDDFILANKQSPLFGNRDAANFDAAIMNPPYFKLRKETDHARAMPHVVHGQPNIYALFMAAAVDMLRPGGELVAITPRSYFNGAYFKRFRKWFFDRLVARQIHIFESRSEAFRDDSVLQENVILKAVKGESPDSVLLTTSVGREFHDVQRCKVPYGSVIDDRNGDHVIRVTANRIEQQIAAVLDQLPNRFKSLDLRISTGPVVTFRSTEFLRHERTDQTAPLLWMHNIRPFATRFPPRNGKPTHILVNEASRRLLVPATRYVLLKRFTAKEEKRRLVAGIMDASDSYSKWVGLENHLNYVYRAGQELPRAVAYGLAAFFNSTIVDRYFRAISGNTQVNATEIRSMPMPDESTLAGIGADLERDCHHDHATVENVVGQALRLPKELISQLCEST